MKAKDDARHAYHHGDLRAALLVAAEAELAREGRRGVHAARLRQARRRVACRACAPLQGRQCAADGARRRGLRALRGGHAQAAVASDRPARQAHRRRSRLCRFRCRQSGAVPADVLVVPAGLRPRAAETGRVDGVQRVGRGRARDSRRRSPGGQGRDARRGRRVGDGAWARRPAAVGAHAVPRRDRRRRPGRRLRRDHPPRRCRSVEAARYQGELAAGTDGTEGGVFTADTVAST